MPGFHWNAFGPEDTVPVKTVASINNSNVRKIESEASCLAYSCFSFYFKDVKNEEGKDCACWYA